MNIKSFLIGTNDEGWRVISGQPEGRNGDVLGAYTVVPIVYRCARLRAKSVQSMPLALYRGKNDISDTPEGVIELARIRQLLYLFELSLVIYGRGHALKEQGVLTRQERLRWVATPGIAPNYSTANGISGYTRNGKQLTVDQVLSVWLQNPSVDIGPDVSPVAVALRAAGVLDNIDTFLERFFDGGAIKATLLQISGNVAEPEKKKLEAWWKKALSGVKNAFNAAAVSAAVTPVPIGDSIKDTINVELNSSKLADVLTAMEVPASLVLANAANYATAARDVQNFYSQCVIPEAQLIVDELNKFYAAQGLEIWLLPERLEAFQQAELNKAKALKDISGGPVLTQSEARQRLSLPPLAPDSVEAQRLELAAQLALAQQMVDLGYSIEQAAQITGLPEPTKQAEPAVTIIQAPPALSEPTEEFEEDQEDLEQEDLKKWQRKALKRLERGQQALCSFESDYINPADAELIQHALEHAESVEAVKAAFKLSEVGEGLTEQERQLFELLEPILRRWGAHALTAIVHGETFDDGPLVAMLQSALMGELLSVALQVAQGLGEEIGPDYSEDLSDLAAQWARTYTYGLVSGITEKTRAVVQNAIAAYQTTPGMTRAQVEKLLQSAFSARRAETIAITEITRAASAATTAYQQQLANNGLNFVRIWRSDNDDIVCPICSPLNGKQEDKWADQFPDGPPAHPRCRCSTTLKWIKQ